MMICLCHDIVGRGGGGVVMIKSEALEARGDELLEEMAGAVQQRVSLFFFFSLVG